MAVKLRLMRMGKTKAPHYRVVVMDGRAPRDGRYIEQIGRYDPRQEPSLIEIDNERAVDWLSKGAQPTEAVTKILQASGALDRLKVRAGHIHTVGGAPETAPKSDQAAANAKTNATANAASPAAEPDPETPPTEQAQPAAESATSEEE
jgi:small subunit ribosomal protein S16